MKLPSELSGEDTVDISIVCSWVKKSRDSARNLDLNDLTAILKECHRNSQFQQVKI
jgi:hypothetical protein